MSNSAVVLAVRRRISFYYEGDITYIEASKAAEITTEWKT